MKDYEEIRDALESVLSEYETDFDIQIKDPDYPGENYWAIIQYKKIGNEKPYHFRCRMNNGTAEMCCHEDIYLPIDKGNLFAYMWFNEF